MAPPDNNARADTEPARASRPGSAGHEARSARFAQGFAQVTSVLMRDRHFMNMPLAELQWLVLPPLLSGQWRVAFVNAPGGNAGSSPAIPAGVALWARVSEDVEARLLREPDKPLRLRANEWTSGDRLWLVAAAGDAKVVPQLLKTLDEREFNGRMVRLRRHDAEGKVEIGTLSAHWKALAARLSAH